MAQMVLRFRNKLKELEQQNRFRSLKLPGGIDLTSNDYLGLKSHPRLRAAALEAFELGMAVGSGGSRLLRGHTQEHEALELYAAQYFGTEKALYFATGFQANYALFTSLPNRHDIVICDELLHASALDGIHGSSAKRMKARHNDPNSFETALKRAKDRCKGQIWVAVESVYSMDGDAAPLAELQTLCLSHDAMLIIDEAHGTGVCGEGGQGLSAGLKQDNLITLHTCGKALGVAGGLVCASAEIIDYLINTARPFIYSTAPPPLQAYLTQKSLELVSSQDGRERRKTLSSVCDYIKLNLGEIGISVPEIEGRPSHIVPLIIGEDGQTVKIAAALQNAGYDIRAIRPPTVPEGTARLRLSLNVNLREEILEEFFEILEPFLEKKEAA